MDEIGLLVILASDEANIRTFEDAISIGAEEVRRSELSRWRYAVIASRYDVEARKEFAKSIGVGKSYLYDCVQVLRFFSVEAIARYYDAVAPVTYSGYLKVMRAVRMGAASKDKGIEEQRQMAILFIEEMVIGNLQTPEETTRALAETFNDGKVSGDCIILAYDETRMVLSVSATLIGVEIGTPYRFRLSPVTPVVEGL